MSATEQAVADYTYWQNALKGEFGPVHDEPCHPGFYRRRISRGGAFVPVAVWEQGGELVALVDGRRAEPDGSLWTYICRYPVTEEAYRQRIETGRWPDEDATVAESLEPPSIGDNGPPTDPAEILAGQIDAALGGVDGYAQIADDETASRAQSLRSRLLELSGQSDKIRESEKRPILEAGRAIDAKWKPLVDKAKAGADAIRKALSAHETRKDQARRAAEAARLRAEQEAAAARARAGAAGKPELKPVTPPPPAPEPVQTAVRGAYGRAASIKTVKVVTVTDQDSAYGFLRTHKELTDLIAKLAQRAVDAGYSVPGTTVEEVKDVR